MLFCALGEAVGQRVNKADSGGETKTWNKVGALLWTDWEIIKHSSLLIGLLSEQEALFGE